MRSMKTPKSSYVPTEPSPTLAKTSPITYGSSACWISTEAGEATHPDFGGAQAIYNVIDSRQTDPQANVVEALRGLGYADAAAHYVHFSYEMVALTPRCAMELGYQISPEDQARS